jgi:glycosyltransferase involved in cell wall biosynthesis
VEVVSNIVDPLPAIPAFDARRDFVFLGNFTHGPNVDAVEWLARLWPPLHARCGEARLRIVGAGLPGSLRDRMQALAGVDVMGHVEDLDDVLATSRVMLAPLRYGAGVKGKINAAFAAGLPVVATSCAIEGMQIGEDPVACIADEEAAFIDAAERVYHDPVVWGRVGEAALRCLTRNFSTAAAREAVERSFVSLGVHAREAP